MVVREHLINLLSNFINFINMIFNEYRKTVKEAWLFNLSLYGRKEYEIIYILYNSIIWG